MVASRLFDFPLRGWGYPFADLERMARQMDVLSNAVFSGRPQLRMFPAKVFPAMNITEDNDRYYIRAELPGIKTDEIKLELTGRNLTISGERKIPAEGENVRYHRREREAGRFSRVVSLPGDVNAEKVEAKMVNGILTVTIGKSEAAKPRQITVS